MTKRPKVEEGLAGGGWLLVSGAPTRREEVKNPDPGIIRTGVFVVTTRGKLFPRAATCGVAGQTRGAQRKQRVGRGLGNDAEIVEIRLS